jgi:hypothetical protein
MGIDWSRIREVADLQQVDRDVLYDSSNDQSSTIVYQIRDDLTPEEKEDAEFWSKILRGIVLVTGAPGQGKGVLSHMIAFKMKRYFKKLVISDTRPRPLFGDYIPFSAEFLVEQLDRQIEVANPFKITSYSSSVFVGDTEELDPIDKRILECVCNNSLSLDYIVRKLDMRRSVAEKHIEKLVADDMLMVTEFMPHVTPDGQWISSRGKVFLRDSIMLLDEFGSKYMYRREPHQPIKRVLLKMFTQWRHMRTVILGIGTEKDMFDPSCYPKVTCEISVTRVHPTRLIFAVHIKPLRYISSTGELEYASKPIIFTLWADEPKDMLGGMCWKDLYNHEQAVALEPPNSLRNRG